MRNDTKTDKISINLTWAAGKKISIPDELAGLIKSDTDPKSAKTEILKYVEARRREGRMLVRADLQGESLDPKIEKIYKAYNVTPETLRKYFNNEKLLRQSKPGRKKVTDKLS